MSLLAIAAVAFVYLCVVTFVMSLLVAAKRADAESEHDCRSLRRRRATWDAARGCARPRPLGRSWAAVLQNGRGRAERAPAELPRSGDR